MLNAVDARASKLPVGSDIRSAVVLERPCAGIAEADIDQVLSDDAGRVFICRTPGEEIVRLLLAQLSVADVIAEGLANDLYKLVADASAENASLSFDQRRRISTTEVDRSIFERLKAEDPTVIDHALLSGVLEPVDFATPVHEPDFYWGVKVKPGHVTAKLVLDRPNDVRRVLDALRQRRQVLVSGPSGAGKSALVWLATAAAVGHMRWYQVTGIATAADADAIVRFVRARSPRDLSPLGLIFDEVGSSNSDLWDVLAREMTGLPAVYLLGSVRQEDVYLIANQSDTAFVRIALDEALAQSVWERLSRQRLTSWTHWREPFEQSEGLMLEYVHLLTQGQRLAAVIGDQIHLREQQSRDDELKIVRSAAVLCAHGGEVDAGRLFELLDLTSDAANRALKRLIDEHLVRETRPGVLGGLHMLRSDALVEASHDGIVFQTADTLWNSLPATTSETLPRVVQSVLGISHHDHEPRMLRKLADMLGNSRDIDQWSAILTGLGLATLERHVASFLSILDRHGVQPAHRLLASSFADPSLDVPELTESDQLKRLRSAVLGFRALPKPDLRTACIKHLPAGCAPPLSVDISQTNRLLSCLAPISGGDSVRIAFRHDLRADRAPDIRQIARLLSTAFLVDPALADSLVEFLGGERALLDLLHSQIPWTTPPTIESDGRHGRTVRSNWHHVTERHQPDPHETVCEICEMLIALSPRSDAAACDAVDPAGTAISVGDFKPWSKNIPRTNLPSQARVAWNVAFRRIFLARTATDSLTDYTNQMAPLVRSTENTFRFITEKWIRGVRIANTAALASKIDRIIDNVNALVYAAPDKHPSTMTEPFRAGADDTHDNEVAGVDVGPLRAGADDTLGSLLTNVLGNLVGRLSTLERSRATATYAGALHGHACKHRRSEIWRTTPSPPLKELTNLSERLGDVSCILHEIGHDSASGAIRPIRDATRKARLGGRVRAAAHHCRLHAERRFQRRLHELENALVVRGWQARCLSRPVDKSDSPYWPAREIAVLVEVEDIETQWLPCVEELLSLETEHLHNDWVFTVAPVMNSQILASLAVRPTSQMPVPDQDFASKWVDFSELPMHSPILLEKFEDAANACMQVSAIVNCRGVQDLHPEEDEVLSMAVDTFNNSREIIEDAAKKEETDHLELALDYLDRNGRRLIDEIEAVKAGQKVQEPICMTPHLAADKQKNEHVVEYVLIRLALMQAECSRPAAV